jgi:hypothetical protein
MTGVFTDAVKRVRVAVIPPGTTDWKSLVQQSTTVVATTPEGNTGLTFVIPSTFPRGVYGFQIEDPSAPTVMDMANVPSLDWAIGIPSNIDPNSALQHQVSDCAAEPGGTLRIQGKNFSSSNQAFLQGADGHIDSLQIIKMDSNSITAAIPSALAAGPYSLWVGASPWSETSSARGQITISPAPAMTGTYASCPLVGDGTTDNSSILQQCLDYHAPAAGSNRIVYITIPAGNFLLTKGVTPQPYEVMLGVSPTLTNFIGKPKGAAPQAWFTIPHYFGMANLSLVAPANPNLLVSYNKAGGDPNTFGHLFFNNINFQSTTDENGAEQMFLISGPDIQVYNSYFLSNSYQVFDINFADGAVVSGNQLVVNSATGLYLDDCQNVIFEGNTLYSQNPVGQAPNGFSGGTGLSIARAFSQYGPSMVSQDIYVGYNTFQNMGTLDQEVITNDGGGGAYFGPIASSTASTVVLADDPAWNWMGTTNPEASAIAIISGTGVGQYSLLESYNGRTINLMTPWKVLPDSTSVVVITQYELNMTIAHNTITNTLGAAINLGDSLEGLIEDNVITNNESGILVAAFGPYGGPASFSPAINTDVLRNTLAVGTGNLIQTSVINHAAGIGILDNPGCLVSGLLIRDNIVPSIQNIYTTNGLNQINGVLVEENEAIWMPTFPVPGILVQDNSQP